MLDMKRYFAVMGMGFLLGFSFRLQKTAGTIKAIMYSRE